MAQTKSFSLPTVMAAAIALTLFSCARNPSEIEMTFERACGACHTTDKPLAKSKDLEGWERTVRAMRARGAELTDEEAKAVANYLFKIRPAK